MKYPFHLYKVIEYNKWPATTSSCKCSPRALTCVTSFTQLAADWSMNFLIDHVPLLHAELYEQFSIPSVSYKVYQYQLHEPITYHI